MGNHYCFIIPRLNGQEIEENFNYYLNLVKKGVAGFIVFGGELETVRDGIRRLQKEAKLPLIIASDLEQGLGQQLIGGTLFPPAMAIASAIKSSQQSVVSSQKLKLLRSALKAIAIEAKYAGINTIFAPVLDINTNPKNPIISTRAFGEDTETVSFFGCEMIKILQANRITACGKHFPGHGDTEIDSHISTPTIKKDLQSLEKTELVPFRNAIKKGVKMIMLGHLNVPAIDPSGIPVSISKRAVRFLRNEMKFKGIIITDALNMHSLNSSTIEEKASLMALRAGVDLLLHPSDPDKVAVYLKKSNYPLELRTNNLEFRTKINTSHFSLPISYFKKHRKISEELTRKAIKVYSDIKLTKRSFLIILNDEAVEKGRRFVESLREKFIGLNYLIIPHGSEIPWDAIPGDMRIIVAVFSEIRAWKGGASPWLLRQIKYLSDRAVLFISFGSPYLLEGLTPKILAYWDSESAQESVASLLLRLFN
ncbi:MAG: glycoside hydrolase family 3 N-terminal domain-containing protein [Nitrospirota bacterium]